MAEEVIWDVVCPANQDRWYDYAAMKFDGHWFLVQLHPYECRQIQMWVMS